MSIPVSLIPSLPIPLGPTAHQYASAQCHAFQDDDYSDKSESVYFNTLATYAVSQYLQQAGFSIELQTSNGHALVINALMDAANLVVPGYGTLECRPIEYSKNEMYVPREVWQERIGYVAVQLDADLSQAVLLGFLKQVNSTTISLEDLSPLDDFYLHLARVKEQAPVQLPDWLQGIFDNSWQAIENILQPRQYQPALATLRTPSRGVTQEKRGCVISLGDNGPSVSMVIDLEQTSDYGYSIVLEFWPTEEKYLPGNLHLSILNDADQLFVETQTRDDNEKIAMKFKAQSGERFSVRMAIGETSVTKYFAL